MMLAALAVRDFVLIEEASLSFSGGFGALTGETGAGKSVLVDAISLLRGERVAGKVIRPGASAAEVEAQFDLGNLPRIRQWLESNALDSGDDLIVRRIISQDNRRSRAFINGRASTASMLAECVAPIIDICGQHENYSLIRPANQKKFLDEFAGASVLADSVRAKFNEWKEAKQNLQTAMEKSTENSLLRAQLDEEIAELDSLGFALEKWTAFNAQLTRLQNAADIMDGCNHALASLENDGGILSRLAEMQKSLNELSRLDSSLINAKKSLAESQAALDEVRREISHAAESLESDPQNLAAAESFIAESHRLARKYRLADASHLGELRDEKIASRDAIAKAENIAELKKREKKTEENYAAAAAELSRRRAAASRELNSSATKLLRRLAMPDAKFEVRLSPLAEPSAGGRENVLFMISTRARVAPGPLKEVASGGELSRVGLALFIAASSGKSGKKSANEMESSAVIFDEIDSGVGGGVASTVGAMLKELGLRRQVLCVTHLAQVAACADSQFRVAPSQGRDGRTALVTLLSDSEREEEIARMLGGARITKTTRAHAAEMLRESRE